RLQKIEMVKPEKYAGRKGKSDRVVLVELFTDAQCPPCVAPDLASGALIKTFKPSEVALLQYHVHVPLPDPLANQDNESRLEHYAGEDGGAPTIVFNGKLGPEGGGSADEAQEKYKEYFDILRTLLETPSKAKVEASAKRQGNIIDITAEVSGLEQPGEK